MKGWSVPHHLRSGSICSSVVLQDIVGRKCEETVHIGGNNHANSVEEVGKCIGAEQSDVFRSLHDQPSSLIDVVGESVS